MQINNISHLSPYMQDKPPIVAAGYETVHKPPAGVEKKAQIDDLPSNRVEDLSKAMEIAKVRLNDTGLNIRFSSGDGRGSFQIEVFNQETNEVIRRFPPDEIIELSASIKEMNGFVMNKAL